MASKKIPPLRYFIGCVLLAAVSVFLEKRANISSGGVTGLSIGIADLLHVSMGMVNLTIKSLIFWFVFVFGEKTIAVWTLIGAGITGISMWFFEMISIDFDWSRWIAFGLILVFARLPIGLLVSKGYSTGGYTAIAQVLWHRNHIPLWMTLFCLNTISVMAMFVSHGGVSGFLTTVIALSTGIFTEMWANLSKIWLDKKYLLVTHK